MCLRVCSGKRVNRKAVRCSDGQDMTLVLHMAFEFADFTICASDAFASRSNLVRSNMEKSNGGPQGSERCDCSLIARAQREQFILLSNPTLILAKVTSMKPMSCYLLFLQCRRRPSTSMRPPDARLILPYLAGRDVGVPLLMILSPSVLPWRCPQNVPPVR